jgi:F420H(2)-dependent quinone reductase
MNSARLLNWSARLGWPARLLSSMHARLYRLTKGRFLPKWAEGMPVLSITTVGRKSGKRRYTAIVYFEDGDDLVVVPANAGSDSAPAWWLNLQANPEAEVQVKGECRKVRAREASSEEEQRLWPKLQETYSGFDAYREFTDRKQPVVLLEPADG